MESGKLLDRPVDNDFEIELGEERAGLAAPASVVDRAEAGDRLAGEEQILATVSGPMSERSWWTIAIRASPAKVPASAASAPSGS